MKTLISDELLASATERLDRVRKRIQRACERADRSPSEITLVGACKRQPPKIIAASLFAGLTELGENYVQEALSTQAELSAFLEHGVGGKSLPPPRWRMIGHLQRNKAGLAVDAFEVIDSVDSFRLMKALQQKAAEAQRILDIGIQVNLSGETSKSGVAPEGLADLVASSVDLSHIRIVGLMTMPAPGKESARHDFARLRELRDMLRTEKGGEALCELNMGMSSDLEIAIESGATVIRVGTDLFGERNAPGSSTKAETDQEKCNDRKNRIQKDRIHRMRRHGERLGGRPRANGCPPREYEGGRSLF